MDKTEGHVLLHLREIGGTRRYKCKHRTLIKANDIIVSDTENTFDCKCALLAGGINVGYVMQFEIDDIKLSGGFDVFNEFNELVSKIAAVKNKLRLQLGQNGLIEFLENREELGQTWSVVRAGLGADKVFQKFSDAEKDALYDAGDKEYLDNYPIEEDLRVSPVHSAFFNELYNQPFAAGSQTTLSQATKPSVLFQPEKLKSIVYGELRALNKASGTCKINLQGNLDKTGFSIFKWKDFFRENYPFIKEELNTYLYEYNADYELELQEGWVKNAKVITYERANHSMEALVECSIDRLD